MISNFNEFNVNLIADMRANEGRPTSGPFLGRPVLILTTTGARTGEQRETPLVYFGEGDELQIIASQGGAPSHPAWYHNLVANPKVTVEVNGDRYEAEAVVPTGAEREHRYAAQAQVMPTFAEYQTKTSREIPVVVLKRVG
ncbi:MAG: nitroreductase family deazaflavin-dependent oxidoreductase [Candidatus Dormibacteraceae bacterium]